ncbi:MAG: PrsW family intramembrane metalloprotease [Candidatus Saccharicenans sp.]|nr:PrsW family intramembrane metalloprotease [Candidatus Saccharicenans sp.]MDI6848790.1 PrsW family intramembrane metalloprotease [Candidatus Saccharicenans sp.]
MEGVIFWKILAAIIGPAIFWIGYFYYKDRRQPEPLINLLEGFLMGVLAGFVCFLTYRQLPLLGLPPGFNLVVAKGQAREIFLYSLGVVGPLEELFKFLPFALVILRRRDLDEPADGVVYASSVAIGFASFENLGYLPMMTGVAFFGRAMASPLTHALFSSVWGYFMVRAKMKRQSVSLAALFSLPLAAIFHGLFNVLTVSNYLRIYSAILVLLLWLLLIYLLERHKRTA